MKKMEDLEFRIDCWNLMNKIINCVISFTLNVLEYCRPFGWDGISCKAIETGMILLIMDIEKLLYVVFQRPINFGV